MDCEIYVNVTRTAAPRRRHCSRADCDLNLVLQEPAREREIDMWVGCYVRDPAARASCKQTCEAGGFRLGSMELSSLT